MDKKVNLKWKNLCKKIKENAPDLEIIPAESIKEFHEKSRKLSIDEAEIYNRAKQYNVC